ncbi:hypothetical protein L7F22_041386 [Adiantum nelumboides]|nr:hypothetical protein [Adiantum nelumboides]
MNTQGAAMICIMNSLQLVVMNGAERFAKFGAYTCYAASHGMSTNDYALVRYDTLELVHQFEVGGRSPTSNHTPIHICLRMPDLPIACTEIALSWSYRMQVTKKHDYATLLDSLLCRYAMPGDIKEFLKIFRHAIENASKIVMGKFSREAQKRKGMSQNPWFDAKCKAVKRKLRGMHQSTNECKNTAKDYNALTRKKRRMYELLKEQQDVGQFKKEPKKTWHKMKGKKVDVMGDFSMDGMYAYV